MYNFYNAKVRTREIHLVNGVNIAPDVGGIVLLDEIHTCKYSAVKAIERIVGKCTFAYTTGIYRVLEFDKEFSEIPWSGYLVYFNGEHIPEQYSDKAMIETLSRFAKRKKSEQDILQALCYGNA